MNNIDKLLKRGQWQEAFLQARINMEESLKELNDFFIDQYKVYEEHRDDDPEIDDTAGIWYDAFINSSTVKFLPSINNLLKVFGKAINEIDNVDAVVNFDAELEDIRDTINSLLQEEDD